MGLPVDGALDFQQRTASLCGDLKARRHKLTSLSGRTAELRAHGQRLLAESNALAEKTARTIDELRKTQLATKRLLEGVPGRVHAAAETDKLADGKRERLLFDAPDLVEALEQATEILDMDFAGTEGSGYETLKKCRKVLERSRRRITIELSLE